MKRETKQARIFSFLFIPKYTLHVYCSHIYIEVLTKYLKRGKKENWDHKFLFSRMFPEFTSVIKLQFFS